MTPETIDPTGLIREAYRIDEITREDCRGIFFDWVVGHRGAQHDAADIRALLEAYEGDHPDHPMTEVLREGLKAGDAPRGRRGGWRARR